MLGHVITLRVSILMDYCKHQRTDPERAGPGRHCHKTIAQHGFNFTRQSGPAQAMPYGNTVANGGAMR
jgi:hypothetical protein